MTEKKSCSLFFEKRVLRPAKAVNYSVQEILLSPQRKTGRKASQVLKQQVLQENKEIMKEQIQASQNLTRQLLNGKTVNPFFDKKMIQAALKGDEVVEFIDPLIPNYEDCHVGHEYCTSKGDIFSVFPKRHDKSVKYKYSDFKLYIDDKSDEVKQTKVTIIQMSKEELCKYITTNFSHEILQEPCIQAMYSRLMGPGSDKGLQWNDKYAPAKSEEVLGRTNRIYASSLLNYIKEWKQNSAKIRQVPKKQPRFHKLDNFDEFIISDVDSEYDGFTVASKHQLIIGPPGVGKTALVSAVAKEAGISILEIHTGMKRSGKELISTLGETTSSRLVGGMKGSLDPSWFQDKSIPKKRRKRIVTDSSDQESEIDVDLISNDSETTKKHPKKSQKKQMSVLSKKETAKSNVGITNFFKPIQKGLSRSPNCNTGKSQTVIDIDDSLLNTKKSNYSQQGQINIASFFKPTPTVGIVDFFKPNNYPVKEQSSETIPETPIRDKKQSDDPQSSISPPPRFHGALARESHIVEPSAEEARTVSARKTVIVLDSADVMTEQDKGFWNGVATLFETSRRPIILCCNENPLISNNFSIPSNLLEFLSKSVECYEICPPEEDELTCYFTLMLLNEGILADPSFIRKICFEHDNDIRQIILYFQFTTRMHDSLIIKDENYFNLYKIESIPSFSSPKKDSIESWSPCIIPDSLDSALLKLNSISYTDHKINASYFSDCSIEISQSRTTPSDCCFLHPLATDNMQRPSHISTSDIEYQLKINSCMTDLLEKRSKGASDCGEASLPFYDFPKWPYLRQRLYDTSNLLFWDGSFQVPRCFITEMLPWLSVLLRHSHLTGESEGYYCQAGRTRRSKRKVLRFFERELSDEQFLSLEKSWF